mmetsp:Transcript_92885/g.167815  ORF Transcript_92885/g.167815 Transcript_92885/m.167815 type:complete len:86 (+) Transcript_92885:719-976(+)
MHPLGNNTDISLDGNILGPAKWKVRKPTTPSPTPSAIIAAPIKGARLRLFRESSSSLEPSSEDSCGAVNGKKLLLAIPGASGDFP